jgi:hypothetical protein
LRLSECKKEKNTFTSREEKNREEREKERKREREKEREREREKKIMVREQTHLRMFFRNFFFRFP